MSNTNVLHDMSLTLRLLLMSRIKLNGQPVAVTVDSPLKPNQPEPRVNLFLYQVLQDEFRRNTHRVNIGGTAKEDPAEYIHDPLALKLYYLMTAFAATGLDEHTLLGEAMQVFHEYQRLPIKIEQGQPPVDVPILQGSLYPDNPRVRAQPLQLVLLNLEVEAIKHIWGETNVPMRTSVAYEAAIVFLERSDDPKHVERVKDDERHIVVTAVPYIQAVEPQEAPVGATVTIYGANLDVKHLRVWFGETAVAATAAHPRWLRFVVPASKTGPTSVKLQIAQFATPPWNFRVV